MNSKSAAVVQARKTGIFGCSPPAPTAILSGLGREVFCRLRLTRVQSVFNSQTANRRLAIRMVAVQAVVALLVALAFLVEDARAALAAAIGGGAVAMGSLLMAWRAMFGRAVSAGQALGQLIGGLFLKWFVVLGALYVSLARLGLPPLPLLAGLVATMAAAFLTPKSKA